MPPAYPRLFLISFLFSPVLLSSILSLHLLKSFRLVISTYINIIEQMHQNKYNYLAWKCLLFLFLLRILTCQVARITIGAGKKMHGNGAMRKCWDPLPRLMPPPKRIVWKNEKMQRKAVLIGWIEKLSIAACLDWHCHFVPSCRCLQVDRLGTACGLWSLHVNLRQVFYASMLQSLNM